jgi:hypothetical protein
MMSRPLGPRTYHSMSELQVTVAVTEPFDMVFAVPSAVPFGATYADLPKTTVSVRRAQTLREVLAVAADELSIRPAAMHLDVMVRLAEADGEPPADQHVSDLLVYAAFRRADDDEIEWAGSEPGDVVRRRNQRLQTRTLVVRDDSGAAVWRKPGLEATYDELLDAAEAGLIDGDRLQPYLIPSIPQGDLGALGEWKHFVDALKVIWDATNGLAAVGGAWGFIELIRRAAIRRSRRAIDTIEHHAAAWNERGAAPADLFRLLIAKPRTTAEIAALVACSEAEAEAILWAFGFSYDDDHLA